MLEPGANLLKGESMFMPPPSLLPNDFLTTAIDTPKFIVPHFAPVGVTLLIGKPLSGKSWLALGMALDFAAGRNVLGQIEVSQGPAVYFQLDNNRSRLATRTAKLLGSCHQLPPALRLGLALSRSNQGGLQELEEFLFWTYDVLGGPPRLIVLDSLAEFRPLPVTRTADAETIASLKKLGEVHDTAFLIVSTSEVEGADAVAVLAREGRSNRATLTVSGQDIEPDTGFTLCFDSITGHWSILGDLSVTTLTKGRAEIMEVLKKADKSLAPLAVATTLGKSPANIRQTMSRMAVGGQLKRVRRGRYTLPKEL